MLTGGCACGDVRYVVSGPISDSTNCHCNACRRASGAPFVSWFSVPRHALVFTARAGEPPGANEGVERASSEHAHRRFCPRCGTALTFRSSETPDEIDVTTASLDDPSAVPPSDHTFTESALSWVELGDLPRFARRRREAAPLPPIELAPLREDELAAFTDELLAFTEELVRGDAVLGAGGDTAADVAERRARAALERLLPEGVRTADHGLFHVVAGGARVGALWYSLLPEGSAHVHWVYVLPHARQRGYAAAALAAAEADARARGARRLTLDVFAQNAAARALYARLGFRSSKHELVKAL